MIENARARNGKCGGVLFFFILAAGFLTGPTLAGQTAATQTAAAPPQKPPAAPAAPSKQTAVQHGDIYLVSERWSRDGDRIIADGNVEVHYKNIILYADHLEADSRTKDVLAVGKVTLHIGEEDKKPKAVPGQAAKPTPPPPALVVNEDGTLSPPPPPTAAYEVVSADRLEFNLDTAQGKMEKAFGMIETSLWYRADSVKREGDIYKMDKMSFTACAQPNPRWGFTCARANLKKDDYIDMWGATLRIKSVPVFYWPYMRYPLNRDRATGFLTPEIGYTGVKGFYITENFYWAIARNMDFTIEANYYAKKGVGAGTEFRYMIDKSSGGTLNAIYFRFNEAAQASSGTAADAYIIRWKHNQTLPGGFSLTAAVDYQSSFDFLREFDANFQRAMIANRSSQIYITKNWSILSLSVRASQSETFFPNYGGPQGSSIIFRYLPQISLNSYKIKLLGPFYLSFGGGFTSSQYGWKSDFDKGKELRMESASFSPVLSLPWSALPWLSANVALSGDFSYYWRTYKTDPAGNRQIVDDPLGVARYGIGIDLIGPRFFKIFELKNTRIKHLIEPVVSYHYDSPLTNGDRIITSGGYFRYHQLTYGLTNHFYIKARDAGPTAQPREILTFGLSQTFYLAPEKGPLSYYRVDGLPPRFSEVTSYLRFYPGRLMSIDFSAGFNPYYKTVSSLRLGAGIGHPSDDFFLSVSWFKSINAWLRGAAEAAQNGLPLQYSSIWDRHQISFIGGLKIPALDLEGKGEVDYNVIEKKILYVMGNLIFHYQCLDLKADVRLFYFRDTPEFRIAFSLGIGNIGRSSSMLGGSKD